MNVPSSTPDGPRFVLDLQALEHNWQTVRQTCSATTVGVVLKNDAYGLGVARVLPTLWRLGCRDFWVSTFDEAEALQSHLPSVSACRVFVLNGLGSMPARDWAARSWIPVLAGSHELPALMADPAAQVLPVAVHLDTGLTRLGFGAHELGLLAAGSPLWQHAKPLLWVTHLGRFEDPQAPQCLVQRERFLRWTAALPAAGRSIATSSSAFAGVDWQFEHARVGSALWGVQTSRRAPAPLQAVASLQAPVLRVCEVAAHTEIGYGGSFITPGPRRIATIALGYADGLPFSLVNRGHLMVNGRPAPIVGGVAMSMLALDVSAFAPSEVRPGQWVEVYGRGQAIETLAAVAGVAPNTLLTLTARLARQHLLQAPT